MLMVRALATDELYGLYKFQGWDSYIVILILSFCLSLNGHGSSIRRKLQVPLPKLSCQEWFCRDWWGVWTANDWSQSFNPWTIRERSMHKRDMQSCKWMGFLSSCESWYSTRGFGEHATGANEGVPSAL